MEEKVELKHGELEKKIQNFKEEIDRIINNSKWSIKNLRVFLTVLSVIITILVAGVIGFGILGTTNILKIHEQVVEIRGIKDKITRDIAVIQEKSAIIEAIDKDTDDLKSKNKQLENQIKNTFSKIDNLIGLYIVPLDLKNASGIGISEETHYFKDMITSKGEKLPEFGKPPKVFINISQGTATVTIKELTKDYIKLIESGVIVNNVPEIELKLELWIVFY